MEFSVDFFRDEVRNGFYIPTALKQAWAAGLRVLADVDRVCQKHGIRYFVDWGTQLGAVRHGGFVPWDDDVDICMCREDYRHFLEVAFEELPEGYTLHDYAHKKDHWTFPVRLVKREKITFDPDYLNENYNFPWLVGVDIFVKDHIYEDLVKEKKRDDEILHLFAVADQIVEGSLPEETREYWLSVFENTYGKKIDRTLDAQSIGIELYRLAEQQMERLTRADSERIGQIYPVILMGIGSLPAKYYDQEIRIPFENTTVPVPAQYHRIVQYCYKDYFQVYKPGGSHDYPYFAKQREQLQEVADFALPEYTYDPQTQMRAGREGAHRESLKGMTEECIERFEMLYDEMCREDITDDARMDAFEESQQLAADLGELIETVKGADRASSKESITSLQAYCDAIYEVCGVLTGSSMDGDAGRALAPLGECLTEMKRILTESVLKRREVIFLATGPDLWGGFRELYEQEMEDDADVYVLALPLFFKDCYGRIKTTDVVGPSKEYPSDIIITPWETFVLTLHETDRIYIQDAYDGENPCLTIPPQFYASAIREHCAELVLVPALVPEEFAVADEKEMYNMGAYVTAPGVVYADRVLLKAEWLRERYLDKLCAWAGEETREYWEKKIRVLPASAEDIPEAVAVNNSEEEKEEKTERRCGKRVLYMIGLDGLVLRGEEYIRNLEQKISEFSDDPETDQITFSYYPPSREEWARNVPELERKVRVVTEHCQRETGAEVMEYERIKAEDYDMYYGSASPAALAFRLAKKELYLLDYDEVLV